MIAAICWRLFSGIGLMAQLLRPLRAKDVGCICRRGRILFISFVVASTVAPSAGWAENLDNAPPANFQRLPPPPPPVPQVNNVGFDVSADAALLDLGSNFLRRLGKQVTFGLDRTLGANPGGGGASENTEEPRFRTWAEAYGTSVRTSPIGDFVGDRRTTYGGVAGFGGRLAPGVNVGLSIDQSHTSIDVPLALQSAKLDLTQFGFNGSIDKGPWTLAVALAHGFGNIQSNRDTGFGTATAGYGARIDGALAELDYYWNIDQSRIVPKAALEYVHASTGSLQEIGGLDPVSANGATVERSRLLLGAEIGHYWIIDRKILDLSAYGKFVDNFSQNFSPITVSLGAESITVQGIGESQYGADAGASASLSLTNAARVYINYDAKFRAALQSHQGTLGVEFKW
jgi:uncharacterized protein with beta-barrel porin domain